jgi:hypothetical protein
MVISSLFAIGAVLLTTAGAAQSSPDLAAELVRLMNERKVTALSARDPADEGRFIGAMLAGPQLLVIRARYSVPALLRERILKSEHQQVYGDLHSAGDRQGRVFVIDSGADGLKLSRDSSDVCWRDSETQTIFNLDWKGQKLKEADYRRRFEEDDKSYADMLSTLISATKAAGTASASHQAVR